LVRDKMKGLLGEVDEDLADFVLEHLKERKGAADLVEGIEPVSLTSCPSANPKGLCRGSRGLCDFTLATGCFRKCRAQSRDRDGQFHGMTRRACMGGWVTGLSWRYVASEMHLALYLLRRTAPPISPGAVKAWVLEQVRYLSRVLCCLTRRLNVPTHARGLSVSTCSGCYL
jgi:hypothetical protein